MVDPRGGRATAATLAVVVVAVDALLAACTHGTASHGGATAHPTASMHVKAAQPSLPAAESGLLPWHMAGPLSREVVTAGSPGQLMVLGGLSASDTSTNGVYAVSTATGAVRRIGALPVAIHDAAVAVSGQRALVFGGGSAASVSTVQSFPLAGGGTGTDVGNLPAPRSDAQAATIGATTYIVGGFDGSKPDASVVATTNGQAYRTIATLPVPVRYAAVAALGGRIYAFGGEAITGPHAGTPVSVIQVVDPARRTASIVGHLPEALAGAAAVAVDGELFITSGGAGRNQAHARTRHYAADRTANRECRIGRSLLADPDGLHHLGLRPRHGRLLAAGRLEVPVSHAGIAVVGRSRVGYRRGIGRSQVGAVQMMPGPRLWDRRRPRGRLTLFWR